MINKIESHYSGNSGLAELIKSNLIKTGIDIKNLKTSDLTNVDEFHIRGKKATLELASKMNLKESSYVLDIGSGIGGAARTLAEKYNCQVTGIDLTKEFCKTAEILTKWVKLNNNIKFKQGNATSLPFPDSNFDSVMTIHTAMNIPNKYEFYREARRVLKPNGVFAVYDVLQGEAGEVIFPVPWAGDPSISYLVSKEEMKVLLENAGFKIIEVNDSTEESGKWFLEMAEKLKQENSPVLSFRSFFGGDFPIMAQNQIQNLNERRIRTVSFICRA